MLLERAHNRSYVSELDNVIFNGVGFSNILENSCFFSFTC